MKTLNEKGTIKKIQKNLRAAGLGLRAIGLGARAAGLGTRAICVGTLIELGVR